MKIVITEQQLKVISELSTEIANEVEFIYKDKNLIVIIPKTQKTSKLYGHGANWCQKEKMGFEMWSNRGLLIRFLFRGGRKIRVTYFFTDKRGWDEKYYWANENGYHVLTSSNDNPFEPELKNPKKIRDTERDILNLISKIPEEAKNAVLNFIENHKKQYDYCYRDTNYQTNSERSKKNILNKFKEYIKHHIDALSKTGFIDLYINQNDKFAIIYSDNEDPNFYVDEEYEDINGLRDRLYNLLHEKKLLDL